MLGSATDPVTYVFKYFNVYFQLKLYHFYIYITRDLSEISTLDLIWSQYELVKSVKCPVATGMALCQLCVCKWIMSIDDSRK